MKLLLIPPGEQNREEISLPQKDLHHIRNVLRKKTGDSIDLSDGSIIYRGTIRSMSADEIIVSGIKVIREVVPSIPVVLAHAIIKVSNLEVSLTKSVETGVALYQPLVTERCCMASRDMVIRKRERLEKKIDEATKQCGRTDLMELAEPAKLESFLQGRSGVNELKLFLDMGGEKNLTDTIEEIRSAQGVCLLIGPEGGFSDREKKLVCASGFQSVRCGDFLWRSETAVIVTTGFVQTVIASKEFLTQE